MSFLIGLLSFDFITEPYAMAKNTVLLLFYISKFINK